MKRIFLVGGEKGSKPRGANACEVYGTKIRDLTVVLVTYRG